MDASIVFLWVNETRRMESYLSNLENEELWRAYSFISKLLRERKLVRGKNLIGDRGEGLVISTYNNTSNEVHLQLAPEGTQNIDAISRKGDRYSIKTVTHPNTTTGVFYGLKPLGDKGDENQKFEYAVVVVLDEFFQLFELYECTWDIFLQYKKWHSRMNAWNLSLTKEFKSKCRLVYTKNTPKQL